MIRPTVQADINQFSNTGKPKWFDRVEPTEEKLIVPVSKMYVKKAANFLRKNNLQKYCGYNVEIYVQ